MLRPHQGAGPGQGGGGGAGLLLQGPWPLPGTQDGQGGDPRADGTGRKGSRGREEPSTDLFIACIKIRVATKKLIVQPADFPPGRESC